MSLYFRRSKKVGPFRFTCSNTGVSTSVGPRGRNLGSVRRDRLYRIRRNGRCAQALLWGLEFRDRRPVAKQSANQEGLAPQHALHHDRSNWWKRHDR